MFNIRIGVATIASFLAACAGGGPTAPEGEAADLILHNGRIVTVDGGFTIARAVAVRGDRFVAVGDDARIRLLASAKTRQIDLRGRTVIPGLMDGHLHNAGGGPGVDLSSSRSVDELLAAVEARARASAAGHATP
jgi:predicted amidohydrolase YtcJ